MRKWLRFTFLIAFGLVTIAGALRIRNSRWGQERRLNRTDLPTLISLSMEDPERPLVHYYLGVALFNAQRVDEAAQAFDRALRLDRNYARSHLGLGMCAMKMNRPDLALQSLQRAVSLDPRSSDAHFVLGSLYMNSLNSNTMALPEFLKVTELQPENDTAWYHLAECRSRLNQPNEAVLSAQQALKLKPQEPRYHLLVGQLFAFKGDFNKAKPYIEKAIDLDSSNPEAHYTLAKLYLARSPRPMDVENAQREARMAVSLNPEMPPIHIILGEVATRRGNITEAVEHYRRAIALDPRDENATFKLAEAYRRLGDSEQAQRLTERFQRLSDLNRDVKDLIDRIKHRPKDASLRLRVARLLHEQGDFLRAANQYQVCLDLRPDNNDASKELRELMQEIRQRMRSDKKKEGGAIAEDLRLPMSP